MGHRDIPSVIREFGIAVNTAVLTENSALPVKRSKGVRSGRRSLATLSGDSAKARIAYQDFFTKWKDADPDIPILKEAKVEYANLQ